MFLVLVPLIALVLIVLWMPWYDPWENLPSAPPRFLTSDEERTEAGQELLQDVRKFFDQSKTSCWEANHWARVTLMHIIYEHLEVLTAHLHKHGAAYMADIFMPIKHKYTEKMLETFDSVDICSKDERRRLRHLATRFHHTFVILVMQLRVMFTKGKKNVPSILHW